MFCTTRKSAARSRRVVVTTLSRIRDLIASFGVSNHTGIFINRRRDAMAEAYFYQRAEDCRQLACEEGDPDLSAMLRELEQTYRHMARRALAPCRAH